MTLIEPELRAALRAEAAAHRPDREAMLNRITRQTMRTAAVRDRPAPRLKIAGAAVAVAAILGGGGIAQWSLAGDGEPRPAPRPPSVVLPVTPSPDVTVSSPAVPDGSPSATSRRSRSRPPASAGPTSPSAVPDVATTERGPVWSDGSVDAGDSQGSSVVTLKTTERLSTLEVTIRVARTPELVSRGGSRQVPGASVTTAVTEEPDALVYRFVLSSGDVLEPGTYVFYARYTHAAGGRDAGADAYAAVAGTDADGTVTVAGAFG
ncbi:MULTISPECIES: hypothetical protein [Actinoplanes]|uniref:hypothetical protein n=1 Tax=Actinoplanes TaxID=1865 RepID=UPI0005F2E55E|nr:MULTISPECIES: hypothetical protein [Actinoplanes]GLY05774.1 hypothetical protein Acsp01_61530 [Actinoplanes sp. NBRC 101535]